MRVPTARVKSPTGGFITINASDLAEHHELHEVQAPGFVDPRAKPADDAEADVRTAAIGFVERMMAAHHDMILESYRELPASERLSHIGEAAESMQGELLRRSEERARQHDEADREASAEAGKTLRVAKGPRGLWFVMRGIERLHPGYAQEAEAQAAMAGLTA